MQSFEIAFSNEKFMRIHAVNFMVYLTVSLVTFGLGLAYGQMADDQSPVPSVELLRTQKWSLIFNNLQLPLQAYFDLFVVFLVSKNTQVTATGASASGA